MELTVLLERMKMEHLLAQLDGICQHTAKGDLDYKGSSPRRAPRTSGYRPRPRRALYGARPRHQPGSEWVTLSGSP